MMAKRNAAARTLRRAERFDIRLGRAFAKLRHRPSVKKLGEIADLADQPPLFMLAAATVAAGIVRSRPAIVRTGLRMAAAEAAATVMKGVIKHYVDRHRPHVDDGEHRIKPGKVADEGPRNSFPSGHSAGAVAVARAVARDHPSLAAPSYALAAVAAAGQIPTAKHFPIDVAIGCAVGVAAEAFVRPLFRVELLHPGQPVWRG